VDGEHVGGGQELVGLFHTLVECLVEHVHGCLVCVLSSELSHAGGVVVILFGQEGGVGTTMITRGEGEAITSGFF